MTVAHGEMGGGCGGDGAGLPVAAPDARMKAVSGITTARWQANARFLEPGNSLSISATVIQSSKMPTTVVRQGYTGNPGPGRSGREIVLPSHLPAPHTGYCRRSGPTTAPEDLRRSGKERAMRATTLCARVGVLFALAVLVPGPLAQAQRIRRGDRCRITRLPPNHDFGRTVGERLKPGMVVTVEQVWAMRNGGRYATFDLALGDGRRTKVNYPIDCLEAVPPARTAKQAKPAGTSSSPKDWQIALGGGVVVLAVVVVLLLFGRTGESGNEEARRRSVRRLTDAEIAAIRDPKRRRLARHYRALGDQVGTQLMLHLHDPEHHPPP